MKKIRIVLVLVAVVAFAGNVFAQGGRNFVINHLMRTL